VSHRLPAGADVPYDERPVRRIDHAWIPLADGTRLAARIWLPESADDEPVPAVMECIPYRKNDNTAVADDGRHAYFAQRGYASIRVDIRGSGDSDGVLLDEYLAQEQDDACEAIAWAAEQPWCTGAVGMIGYSWGGFATLQAAARRPPALRAIVTVDSTDDRYADDVHYMGGCVLAYYMLSWAASMHVYATLPPDPQVVGERWREAWLERLESAHPMVEPWLTHQLRDGYWRHGSVCEDFGAIECAVYAVSGWADGYRSAVLRLMEGLTCPKKALIGPWSHTYPVEAQAPGPAIGFLQECVRWWDQWLKGADTGIMDEPQLRFWMQEPVAPAPTYAERPGRWVAERSWPSPRLEQRRLLLGDGTLGQEPQPAVELTHVGAQEHGMDAGDWDPFGGPADLPPDQRAEDGRSLTFTSPPLDEPLELLGVCVARLELAADRERALVSVRLCDVDPDGRSCLVTRGLLNLTHREGHDRVVAVVPGERMAVDVPMKAIGQRIPAGHRLRLSVSSTYWPWAWPSPDPVRLTLLSEGSALLLPVRPPSDADASLPPFEPPALAPRPPVEILELLPGDQTTGRSIADGTFTFEHRYPHVRFSLPESGIEIERYEPDRFAIAADDPLSARARCERRFVTARPDAGWRTTIESESEMAADREVFRVTTTLRAFEGAECVFARAWSFVIPRQGV
jgi:putative CocE/NonD family hydrolase